MIAWILVLVYLVGYVADVVYWRRWYVRHDVNEWRWVFQSALLWYADVWNWVVRDKVVRWWRRRNAR